MVLSSCNDNFTARCKNSYQVAGTMLIVSDCNTCSHPLSSFESISL